MHSNSLNWYKAECSREKAIELLSSKENGTYLVRSSSKTGFKYVLSLVTQNLIKHLPIEENQSGCFLKSMQKRLPINQPNLSSSSNNSRSNSPISLNSNSSLIQNSASSTSINKLDIIGTTKSDDSIIKSASSQESILKFRTLTELIVFYSENDIKAENIYLETKLIYPIFYGETF